MFNYDYWDLNTQYFPNQKKNVSRKDERNLYSRFIFEEAVKHRL